MNKTNEIKSVIELLSQNGYIAIKKTQKMLDDGNDCLDSDGTKDCCECSCNRCLLQ